MLTAVCIYFLFSLRIVFDLSRFKENDPTTAALVDDLKLFQTIDDSIACAYLGNIAYHGRRSELATFHSYLREHAAIRPGSVTSWFDYFQGWQEDQQRLKHVSRWNTTSGEPRGSLIEWPVSSVFNGSLNRSASIRILRIVGRCRLFYRLSPVSIGSKQPSDILWSSHPLYIMKWWLFTIRPKRAYLFQVAFSCNIKTFRAAHLVSAHSMSCLRSLFSCFSASLSQTSRNMGQKSISPSWNHFFY